MLNRRKIVKAAVAAPAILKLWPGLIREAQAVLTPTGLVPAGTFAEASALPNIPGTGGATTTQFPNLFKLNDGTAITTKAQWAQRRAQVKELYKFYWIGHFPGPSPISVVSGYPVDTPITTSGVGTMTQRTVYLRTGPGGAIPFWLNMYLPSSGSGPRLSAPVTTSAGAPSSTMDRRG